MLRNNFSIECLHNALNNLGLLAYIFHSSTNTHKRESRFLFCKDNEDRNEEIFTSLSGPIFDQYHLFSCPFDLTSVRQREQLL